MLSVRLPINSRQLVVKFFTELGFGSLNPSVVQPRVNCMLSKTFFSPTVCNTHLQLFKAHFKITLVVLPSLIVRILYNAKYSNSFFSPAFTNISLNKMLLVH